MYLKPQERKIKDQEILQNDCNTFQLINDNLENELIDAREQVFKEQQKKVYIYNILLYLVLILLIFY